jgi:hypothetical protein
VSGLLSKLRAVFSGDRPPSAEVVHLFQAGLRARAKLELVSAKSLLANPPIIVVSIESVGQKHFVISEPSGEAARHLSRGRRYVLTFFDDESRLIGETECLGRTQYVNDRDQVLHTFRFSLPHSLARHEANRRQESRFVLETKPEVVLSSFELKTPIYGEAIDVSRRGVQIRCQNAQNKFQVGQTVMLKMELPAPIGAVAEQARIMHIDATSNHPAVLVGVVFPRPLTNFDEWAQMAASQAAQRKAG